MKAFSYIQSLLPSFDKVRIIEDCDVTRSELLESTIPSYKHAVELLDKWKFKSPLLEAHLAMFGRMVPAAGRDNIVVAIHKSFKHILENLDEVSKLVDSVYGDKVAGAGLTYLKANLLQFVECTAFVSKYSRKLLDYIYLCETAEYPDSEVVIGESLSPAEIDWLNVNMVSFCQALNITAGNPVNIKKQLSDIPEIVITSENQETLPESLGADKIDPMKMGLIPIWMNPVYHIGMFFAEWQAKRYKASKEEMKLLQLRKLKLEKLVENKPDAKIQQQIQYMEGRIATMNYELAKMEKKHG